MRIFTNNLYDQQIIKMSEYFEFHMSSSYRSGTSSYLDSESKSINRHDPSDRRRALEMLKDMVGASTNLILRDKSCYVDDEFLMRFLYARKFRTDEAFELLVNYHSYLQRNQLLLQRLTIFDETLQLALRDGFPSILENRDRRGRKVIVFFTSNWDPALYSIEVVFRALLLSLEKLLEDSQNQSQGFIIIVDWTNFTLRQSSHLAPKTLKLMIEGLQDCLPVKFKAIHFIAQPWYVEAALAVIKPFLKEKTRNRIKLHGGNLSTLHECVPKDILPTELGGEGPALNPLDWYHTLLESSQTMDSPKSYRITETTIYSMPPKGFVKGSAENLKSNFEPTAKTALIEVKHNL